MFGQTSIVLDTSLKRDSFCTYHAHTDNLKYSLILKIFVKTSYLENEMCRFLRVHKEKEILNGKFLNFLITLSFPWKEYHINNAQGIYVMYWKLIDVKIVHYTDGIDFAKQTVLWLRKFAKFRKQTRRLNKCA